MSEAISQIWMSTTPHKGNATPSRAIPLSPEHDKHRGPLHFILDLTVTQMLAFLCAILAAVVIGLVFVAGYALINDSNQKQQISNLNTRVNQLDSRLTLLEHR